MHALEHCYLYAIDAATLAADGSRSPQAISRLYLAYISPITRL